MLGSVKWILIFALLQGENDVSKLGTGIWNPDFDSFSSYQQCQDAIAGRCCSKTMPPNAGPKYPFKHEIPRWNESICGYDELRDSVESDFYSGMSKEALEEKYDSRILSFNVCQVSVTRELRPRCVPLRD